MTHRETQTRVFRLPRRNEIGTTVVLTTSKSYKDRVFCVDQSSEARIYGLGRMVLR